jgi:hypothetical protein
MNTLRIEYAGIIALKLEDNSPPTALIVDVAATMGDDGGVATPRAKHYPSMMIEVSDHVTTPEPTFVTATPTEPDEVEVEQHIWALDKGSTLNIQKVDASGTPEAVSVTFDGTEQTDAVLQQFPHDAAALTGLGFMANLAKLANSKTMATDAPIFATVPINYGDVRALAPAATTAVWVTYSRNGAPVDTEYRLVAALFVQEFSYASNVVIDFQSGSAAQRIQIGQRIDARTDTRIVVSNLCSCPTTGPMDHFNAFLHLLSGHRTVSITTKLTGLHNPFTDPPNCYSGLLDLRS